MTRPTDRPYTVGLYLNLCMALGLSIKDLEGLTYGMITDMIIEKNNNEFTYNELATQADFDRF